MKRILLAAVCAALMMAASAATTPLYLDESLPIEQRVENLLDLKAITTTEIHHFERKQHSFHSLLKEMTYQYREWKHEVPEWRLDWELSLSDRQVKEILALRQIWHPSHGMQTVHFNRIRTESVVCSLWEVGL